MELSARLAKPKESEPFSLQSHFRPGFVLVCDRAGEILPRARAAVESEAGLEGRIRLKKLLHSGQKVLAKYAAVGLPKIPVKRNRHRRHRASNRLELPAVFSHRAEEEENKEVKMALKAMVHQRRELAEARKSLAKLVSAPKSRRYVNRRQGTLTSVAKFAGGMEEGRELTDAEIEAAALKDLKELKKLEQKKSTADFLKNQMGSRMSFNLSKSVVIDPVAESDS